MSTHAPNPASNPLTRNGHPGVPRASFIANGLAGIHASRRVDVCWFVGQDDPDPVSSIASIVDTHTNPGSSWAIMLSYELGGWVEPHARSRTPDPSDFPLAVLMRMDEGKSPGPIEPGGFTISGVRSLLGQGGYTQRVEQVRAYIRAGDVYQVNLAHHLQGSFGGDPMGCARVLMDSAAPRYGATMHFEIDGISHTICSISPELFIRLDRATRVIQSEPMKGTRPIDADARELEDSPKDRAELNMITDLMRNDIGRVCTLGSVRVRDARKIEPHPSGVIQASSIVEGTLRDGVGIDALIRAVFPPGSVTGAPKIRAMQIIDELEQRPRGPYCGSIMHIDPQGNIEASVAIRTAHIWGEVDPERPGMIRDGQFVYPVGAGIVADSDPASEWDETLVKASILQRALGIDLTRLG